MEGTPCIWWSLRYWYLSKQDFRRTSSFFFFYNGAYTHIHTHTQRPNLNCSTHTRWHTLNNDSQLLPDTIKHCETLAGLPSESHTVSHCFLIFHSNPFFRQTRVSGEQHEYVWTRRANDQAACVTLTVHKSSLSTQTPLTVTRVSMIRRKIAPGDGGSKSPPGQCHSRNKLDLR